MIAARLADLRTALMLLTRLPVWPTAEAGPPDLARTVWAYPLVGALVGGIGAAVFALLIWAGVPHALAAMLGLGATILATGAFHEDGLADVADGLGGGWDREAKLSIMKDSRIGTYGTVAVVGSLAVRAATLALMPVGPALLALVSLQAASRGAILLLLTWLEPARPQGMGTVAADPPGWALALGLLLAAVALLVWPLPAAVPLLLIMGAASLALAWIARRQLGGYTGDILGAGQQLSEVAGLVTLAALFA